MYTLSKLEEFLNGIEEKEESVSSSNLRLDQIITLLKGSNDTFVYTCLINGFAILLGITIVLVLLKIGYFWNVLLIVAMIGFLGYIRYVLIQKHKEVICHKWLNELEASPQVQHQSSKIDYIIKAVDLKFSRIGFTRVFYMVFFPVFVIYASWLILSEMPFNSVWIAGVLSFGIFSVLWYFIYSRDLRILDRLQGYLGAMQSQSSQTETLWSEAEE